MDLQIKYWCSEIKMIYKKGIMKYTKEEDYCSYSPEKLFGVNHNYGCYLHDRQYRNEVKNRKTRKQADIQLRDVIYYAYYFKDKKTIGWIVSRIYYMGVRLGGKRSWIGS